MKVFQGRLLALVVLLGLGAPAGEGRQPGAGRRL